MKVELSHIFTKVFPTNVKFVSHIFTKVVPTKVKFVSHIFTKVFPTNVKFVSHVQCIYLHVCILKKKTQNITHSQIVSYPMDRIELLKSRLSIVHTLY